VQEQRSGWHADDDDFETLKVKIEEAIMLGKASKGKQRF
jgi:hypothetical protein